MKNNNANTHTIKIRKKPNSSSLSEAILNSSTIFPDSISSFVETMPVFPGGNGALTRFLSSNTIYPERAKKDNVSGTVYVRFVVDQLGKIKNVTILRGVNGYQEFSDEALRIVSLMPDWTPGVTNGSNVPVAFTLPVKFFLK